MLAIELYQTLNNDGVQLWAEGEKLRFAPKEKITPFLLAELKANKNELLSLLAANDPPPKGEIKPVIQETVRQVLTAQIEPLKKDSSTTDLSHQLAGQVKQGGGVQPPMEDGHLSHKTKVQPTPQIEESSRPEVLGAVKPEPQKNGAAPKLYGDDIFPQNGEISPSIANGQSHTTDEVLDNHERPLFYHLLACPYCHVKKAQYCVDGYAVGNIYDALLLNRDEHRQGVSHWLCVSIERVYQAVERLRLLTLPMHHRHPIPRYKRENMAIHRRMRRLSITGQLAKCVSQT